jgi:hypothetical protein
LHVRCHIDAAATVAVLSWFQNPYIFRNRIPFVDLGHLRFVLGIQQALDALLDPLSLVLDRFDDTVELFLKFGELGIVDPLDQVGLGYHIIRIHSLLEVVFSHVEKNTLFICELLIIVHSRVDLDLLTIFADVLDMLVPFP